MRRSLLSGICFLRSWFVFSLAAVAGSLALISCGSAVETATAPAQTRCDIDLDAQSTSFTAAGGTGAIRISTNRECAWSVQVDASWLTLSSPVSGQGAASVPYTVAANADPAARTAVIRVDDRQLPISQQGSPCEVRLSSTRESVDQSGGERRIQISTSSGQCRWTAVSDVDWIVFASGQSGSGNGEVAFTVAASDGPERSGAVMVAGLVVTVVQTIGCSYTVDPTAATLAASGGAQVATVRSGAGCAWTASTAADWLTLSPGTGSGSGDVRFSAPAWNGPPRSTVVRIADQTLSVTQNSGCSVSFSPAMVTVEASGAQSSVRIEAMPGCGWSASSAAPWIVIATGAAGSGDGLLQLVVSANAGPPRQASVAIAGRSLQVSQANGCTYTATPTTHTLVAAAGKGTVLVSTNSACRWGASSPVPWISVQQSAIVGTGVLTFYVVANTGPARTATVTVAGHPITVNQASP